MGLTYLPRPDELTQSSSPNSTSSDRPTLTLDLAALPPASGTAVNDCLVPGVCSSRHQIVRASSIPPPLASNFRRAGTEITHVTRGENHVVHETGIRQACDRRFAGGRGARQQ